MRDLFMEPRNFFRMREAVLSLLSGDVFDHSPIRSRLLLFKAVYYIKTFFIRRAPAFRHTVTGPFARSMNFVVPDSRKAARRSDLSATPAASHAATAHAVLIPSYNTGSRLRDTVAVVRRLGWPVWVVIDGSTDGSGEVLLCDGGQRPRSACLHTAA